MSWLSDLGEEILSFDKPVFYGEEEQAETITVSVPEERDHFAFPRWGWWRVDVRDYGRPYDWRKDRV